MYKEIGKTEFGIQLHRDSFRLGWSIHVDYMCAYAYLALGFVSLSLDRWRDDDTVNQG